MLAPKLRISQPQQKDLHWGKTVCLLAGEGADGSTTFVDSSPVAANFNRVNATISTEQVKHGTSAMKVSAGYLTASGTPENYTFGTGDFTIETWLYFTAPTTYLAFIFDFRADGVGPDLCGLIGGSGLFVLISGGGFRFNSGNFTPGMWHHLAVTRSGTTTRAFQNGTIIGTLTGDTNNYSCAANRPMLSGASNAPTLADARVPGYLDDFRITKGFARYTANFTPPGQLPRRG